jgi:cytochrome c
MVRGLLYVVVSAFALSSIVFAQSSNGSSLEARAMLEKAATELKADQTAALAKFNDPKGPFRDRDLYVFCFDMGTGKITTHINPSVIGTDGRTAKEKDGTPFGQKLYDAAVEGKINTVSYNFPKPGSTEPVAKEAYVTRVGNAGCAVGYYK